MKRTHSARNLFHLFCSMTNADLEGFKTYSRNVYFENGVLWSYGPHYPMAVKTSFGVGMDYREVVLINARKSSVTTQKHKSQLNRSIKPNQWVFHVPSIRSPRDQSNIDHLLNGIVDEIDHILRGLKYSSINRVTNEINDFNRYAQAFNLKSFKLDPVFYTDLAIFSRETEQRFEGLGKRKAEKQAKDLIAKQHQYANEVKNWYACTNTIDIPPQYFGLNYDPIRVNGDIVETPRGAEVPLTEAQRLVEVINNSRINIVGHKVGEFEILSRDEKYLQIGCHKINIQQAVTAIQGGNK